MSINWVMVSTDGQSFVKLPNERILYTSPPRTSLEIATLEVTSETSNFSVKSDGGTVYITNQRLVYLPTNPKPALKSFSSPILNIQDAYVRAPFFGANSWFGHCTPVPGGGIPPPHSVVELKLTFRDGGAFDFHSTYEEIKERLNQAYWVARENTPHRVDLTSIDLEPLPVYRPVREFREGSEIDRSPPYQLHSSEIPNMASHPVDSEQMRPVPTEAPPDYEETQVQAAHIDQEQRLRQEAQRNPMSTV